MYLKMAININGNSRGKPFVPSLSIVSLLTDQKINTEKNEARQKIWAECMNKRGYDAYTGG